MEVEVIEIINNPVVPVVDVVNTSPLVVVEVVTQTGGGGGKGDKGDKGDPGDNGLSSYQIALNNGFVGTEEDWLISLHGENGINGTDGADGVDGLSAYQIAVNNGYTGNLFEWLESLKGDNGANGASGNSAYEIAKNNGFVGTESEWLASLKGEDGEQGIQGPKGDKGDTGAAGASPIDYPQQDYTGTLNWTGTLAPVGETKRVSGQLNGKLMTLNFTFNFTTEGTGLTAVLFPLPTWAPTPLVMSGVQVAEGVFLYPGSIVVSRANGSGQRGPGATLPPCMQFTSDTTKFNLFGGFNSASVKTMIYQIIYRIA